MKKQALVAIFIVGAMILAAVAVAANYQMLSKENEEVAESVASQKLREAQFQYYEPSFIPGNHQIHRKLYTRSDLRSDVSEFSGYTDQILLSLHEDNNVFSILEFNNADGTYDRISESRGNNEDPSCRFVISPKGQKYESCIDEFEKNIETTIRFNKGTTYVVAHLDSHPIKSISAKEQNMFVDSFERSSGVDLDYRLLNGAG